MYNSGRRGRRANDGYGILSQADRFNQTEYPIPVVNSFAITNGSYVPLDDTAVDTAGGQTIVLYGSGFAPGATVTVGGDTIGAVTYLDQGRLTFTSPAKSSGSYTIVVINANGGAGILVPGLVYSGVPTWQTSAGSVGSVYETTNVSSTFVATGDAPMTYSILSGSLPPGTSLSTTGVLTGSAPIESGSTTYSFTIRATDGQLQDTDRSFSLTVNTDVVTMSSPTNNQVISSFEYKPISNVTVAGTSAAGYGVVYSANTTPTGISLNSTTGVISGTVDTVGNTFTRLTTTANTTNRTAVRDVVFNINPDVVTWNNPANNFTISTYEYVPISNVTANATSAAGFGVLYSANTIPTGITLNANTGLISGAPTTVGNTFALLTATANTTSRSNTRNIIYNVNQDVVTWSSPTNNTLYEVISDFAITNVTLSANSAAGFGIQYSANALPTGLTLSGSTISGTPTTVQTVNTLLTATANTTGRTATRFISWSVAIGSDTFWRNNRLLLSADNTIQTSSFVNDNSNNNTQLTVFGDTRPSNFNPYQEGYYSNYFDGTGDYLSFPNSSNFAFGTGSFTIEFWINAPLNNDRFILGGRAAIGTMHITTGGSGSTAGVLRYVGSSTIVSSNVITDNTWHHCAIVRSGSSAITLYVDGVSVGTGTDSTNYTTTSGTWYIGSNDSVPNNNILTGYISNLRVIRGTAVYTSAFTPSTTPLTAIANTQLLTCESNRFIDGSVNNVTITRNGDTRISSVHPFTTAFQLTPYYSVQFNGTSDTINTPSTTALDVSTSNFWTVECWFNISAITGDASYYLIDSYFNGVNRFMLYTLNNTLYCQWISGGVAKSVNATIPSANAWHHIAFVRNGSTYQAFINGTSAGTVTDALALSSGARSIFIGGSGLGSGFLSGFISNVRLVIGTAVYTSNFTPSTTPLTAIANTALLTCQDNSLRDNSTNNLAITPVSNNLPVRPVTVAPFTSTYTNNTITTYGSAYFDGSGDYVTVPDLRELELFNDFTIECWIYYNSVSGTQVIVDKGWNNSGFSPYIIFSGDGNLVVYASSSGASWDVLAGSSFGTVVAGQWYHIALTRRGNTIRLFLNGSVVATVTNSSALMNSASALGIGGGPSSGVNPFNGYISDLRIIKGTAFYTSNFLPEFTRPITAVANTQLLTFQTNGNHNNTRFKDNSAFNNLINRAGNVTQGTFSPYGDNWSNFFDGSGDYLTVPNNTALQMGSGDFTIEYWINYSSVAGYVTPFTKGYTSAGDLLFQTGNGDGRINVYMSGSIVITESSAAAVGQWYHYALVRNGTSLVLYRNGVSVGSATNSTNLTSTQQVGIGATGTAPGGGSVGQYGITGYISNLRIVKGTAVYTSAFTPSTTPLTAVSGTSLLTCADNGFIDESLNNFTITRNGDVRIEKFSPFGTVTVPKFYSGFFDGSGDYLQVAHNNAFLFGANNFTMECWAYPRTSSAMGLFAAWSGGGNWQLRRNSSGRMEGVYNQSGGTTIVFTCTTTTVSANVWSHVAFVRNGSTFTIYVNGVADATTSTFAGSLTSSTPVVRIGVQGDAFDPFNGFISNARIVNGTAIYTSNFTPPTQPLTAVANTSLLTCQDNTFRDNSNNSFNITALGDSRTLLVSPFTPTASSIISYSANTFGGSIYLDGTGDYLSIPNNSNFAFGTDNFTIEYWMYANIISGTTNGNVVGYGVSGQTGAGHWNIMIYLGNLYYQTGQGTSNLFNVSIAPYSNAWTHYAIVRSSGTTRLYINGVQQASGADTTNYTATTTTAMTVGYNAELGFLTGYISDLRIVKGSALYTSNFIPSPAPLTPTIRGVANTVSSTRVTSTVSSTLLINGSDGGVDDATRTVNLETVGDVRVTQFSPYSGNHYSLFFPGIGNGQSGLGSPGTLATSNYTAGSAILGSGDWTIDVWCYGTATVGNTPFGNLFDMGTTFGILRYQGSTGWQYFVDGTAKNVTFSASFPSADGRWVHHAIVRSGTTLTWFINGNQAWTGTSSTNFTATNVKISSTYAYAWLGYQSHRFVKGSALYNASASTITIPTGPLTNIAGTMLLTNGNKHDVSSNNITPTLGESGTLLPTVSTVNPFRVNTGQSYYFDGTGDYLYSAGSTNLALGSGDFTVETWVYPTVNGVQSIVSFGNGGTVQPFFYINGLTPTLFYNNTGVATSPNLTLGVWNHVAATRSGNTIRVFTNGVSGTAASPFTDTFTSAGLWVGSNNIGGQLFTGYLSDLRITRNTARYTANFTPAIAPFITR